MTRPVELPAAALLFDLDGVLIDSRAVLLSHWQAFAGWYGLDPEPLLASVHGVRATDVVTSALPGASPDELLAAVRRHAELELADTEGIVALPGADEVLSALDDADWAVVTAGTSDVACARMRAAGLTIPKVLVSASDVQAGKPDPEGYLTAARRLSSRPGDCVVIEDAPVGITAGRAAGATVLGLATTHQRDELIDADLVVEDLTAVSIQRRAGDLLLRLNTG